MKVLKTVVSGVKRAFKVNVTEQTPDPEVNDATAKAIKSVVRGLLFLVLMWLFPEQAEQVFNFVTSFIGE